MNILIVEDSSVMRSMIAKTIQLSGLNLRDIYQAADGREGLASLDRHRMDLDDGVCGLALAVAGGLPGRLPAEIAAMPGQSLVWDTL